MNIFEKAFLVIFCLHGNLSMRKAIPFRMEITRHKLVLQKNYHTAQVVSCKVFSLENETDSTKLIRLEEYRHGRKNDRRFELNIVHPRRHRHSFKITMTQRTAQYLSNFG